MKNRPFYGEYVEAYHKDFEAVEMEGVFGYGENLSGPIPLEGNSHKVIFDGEVYYPTTIEYVSVDDGSYAIGNLSIVNQGNDTGEPFYIIYDYFENYNEYSFAVATKTKGQHSVSIFNLNVKQRLQPAFLPETGIPKVVDLTSKIWTREELDSLFANPLDIATTTIFGINICNARGMTSDGTVSFKLFGNPFTKYIYKADDSGLYDFSKNTLIPSKDIVCTDFYFRSGVYSGTDGTPRGKGLQLCGKSEDEIVFCADWAGNVDTKGTITSNGYKVITEATFPPYTSADEGKILKIVGGVPTWVSLQSAEEVSF